VSFAAITLCVTFQRVFVVVAAAAVVVVASYFVIDSVRQLLDIPSYLLMCMSVGIYIKLVTVSSRDQIKEDKLSKNGERIGYIGTRM
jgi:succinyl-CoA synthetase alpha subunit